MLHKYYPIPKFSHANNMKKMSMGIYLMSIIWHNWYKYNH